MPRFTITIRCDNDAFQPDPRTELCRILEGVVHHIKVTGLSGLYETIVDSNGNDVGRYAIKNNDGSIWNEIPEED